MSYQEKNITVSLVNFTLILGFYLIRVFQMIQGGSFNPTNVFRLWGIVIILGIVVTILGTILTHIVLAIVQAIRTQTEPVEDYTSDERDKLIELKGSRIAYIMFSLGVFVSMLTFVFDTPPLVMFSLLILSSIIAEIIGGVSQLYFYRRGV